MTVNETLNYCKDLISKEEITLDELNRLINMLSSHYQDAQILRLHKLYPQKETLTAVLWDTMQTYRFTRRQFANKLGLSYDQLCALLRGRNRLSIETIRRLHVKRIGSAVQRSSSC